MESSTAVDVLERASAIVAGARRVQHGTPERSGVRIAALWSAYLSNGPSDMDVFLTPRDVYAMMALLKIARGQETYNVDNCVDLCGYGALMAEAGRLEGVQKED